MSERQAPMSRRAMVKAAAATPLLVLAAEVARARGPAGQEALALLQEQSEIDPGEMRALLAEAEKYYGDKGYPQPFPKDKLERITSVLWAFIVFGVNDQKKLPPGMLIAAYRYKSGHHIIDNLDDFDQYGLDSETNLCAYLVGYLAVIKSGSHTEMISPENYESAWQDVKGRMMIKKARIAGMKKDGPKDGSPSLTFGSGC